MLFGTTEPSSELLRGKGTRQKTQLTWASISLSYFSSSVSAAKDSCYQTKSATPQTPRNCHILLSTPTVFPPISSLTADDRWQSSATHSLTQNQIFFHLLFLSPHGTKVQHAIYPTICSLNPKHFHLLQETLIGDCSAVHS